MIFKNVINVLVYGVGLLQFWLAYRIFDWGQDQAWNKWSILETFQKMVVEYSTALAIAVACFGVIILGFGVLIQNSIESTSKISDLLNQTEIDYSEDIYDVKKLLKRISKKVSIEHDDKQNFEVRSSNGLYQFDQGES